MKPTRVFLGTAVLIFALAAVPVSQAAALRGSVASVLKWPLALSRGLSQTAKDLFHFRRNAEAHRRLQRELASARADEVQSLDIRLENERLTKLLGLRSSLGPELGTLIYCRVIGRSPSAWNRTLLIDKGARDRIRENMPVLSDASVIGKVAETGAAVSKVVLITDPNFRIGVLVQRTRQQGVLYGTAAGGCRVKYLSTDMPLKAGDVVETAGVGGLFPKGLLVGSVVKAWKEPGQLYQVAEVRPFTDLSPLEEVACVE